MQKQKITALLQEKLGPRNCAFSAASFTDILCESVNFGKISYYWLTYWHILISKGTSGFTSNTLLIRIQYCYQFKYFIVNKSYEKNG